MEKITPESLRAVKTKRSGPKCSGSHFHNRGTSFLVSNTGSMASDLSPGLSCHNVSECKPCLWCLPALWPWAYCSTSWCLRLFICKMGIIIKPIRFISGNLEIIQMPSHNILMWLHKGQVSKLSRICPLLPAQFIYSFSLSNAQVHLSGYFVKDTALDLGNIMVNKTLWSLPSQIFFISNKVVRKLIKYGIIWTHDTCLIW